MNTLSNSMVYTPTATIDTNYFNTPTTQVRTPYPTNTNITDYNKNLASKQGSTLGNISGIIGNAGTALQGLGGLATAFTAYQNYKLAQEQFATEKAFANRNLANSAQLVNNAIDSSANMAYHLGGKSLTNTSGNAAIQKQYMSDANKLKVDGSAI